MTIRFNSAVACATFLLSANAVLSQPGTSGSRTQPPPSTAPSAAVVATDAAIWSNSQPTVKAWISEQADAAYRSGGDIITVDAAVRAAAVPRFKGQDLSAAHLDWLAIAVAMRALAQHIEALKNELKKLEAAQQKLAELQAQFVQLRAKLAEQAVQNDARRVADLNTALANVERQLDTQNKIIENLQRRIQELVNRAEKANQHVSQLQKKAANSQTSLIRNLK